MPIYGECIGATNRTQVLVSQLETTGCALAAESTVAPPEGDNSLWIGAIGPLPITTMRGNDGSIRALFKEPLDTRILEHFNCG